MMICDGEYVDNGDSGEGDINDDDVLVILMIRVVLIMLLMISDLLAPPSSGETTMHCSGKIIQANEEF